LFFFTRILQQVIINLWKYPESNHIDRFNLPEKKDYRKLTVDAMPILEIVKKYDCNALLAEYALKHGKPLKPIKHQKDSNISTSLTCPCCGAPHIYIYDNTGGRGQFLCKVCDTPFSLKNRFSKSVILKCPHCESVLQRIKERNDFHVHKCINSACCFYLENFSKLSAQDKLEFKEHPESFKLHYIYREYNFPLDSVTANSLNPPKVQLSNIHSSPHVLGLILSYFSAYGLSSRMTSAIMWDIHNVKISRQTVLNYARSASFVLKPFVDNFKHKLSDSFCGDETYIKVRGKTHYIFFFFDSVKKVIVANYVSSKRDTFSAICAIYSLFKKFKDALPPALHFFVDGNPVYLLAQHFFAQNNINFDVTQIIGLANKDETSKEFRPLKQIIERLNRTFKYYYKHTNGFDSIDGAISYVNLFTAYFNFLRPHSALDGDIPATIPELSDVDNMPGRWCKLLSLAQDYIASIQVAIPS
jgi:transposase-like protein